MGQDASTWLEVQPASEMGWRTHLVRVVLRGTATPERVNTLLAVMRSLPQQDSEQLLYVDASAVNMGMDFATRTALMDGIRDHPVRSIAIAVRVAHPADSIQVTALSLSDRRAPYRAFTHEEDALAWLSGVAEELHARAFAEAHMASTQP